MPRERSEHNPDVNSPIADDTYDSDEKLPGKDKQYDLPEPEGDDNESKHPDIDEPYPSPEDDGDIYPVEDPPLKDWQTGDVNDSPKHM